MEPLPQLDGAARHQSAPMELYSTMSTNNPRNGSNRCFPPKPRLCSMM